MIDEKRLRFIVNRRLTFNSMFDPLCKIILNLDEKDFDSLFNQAKIKLENRANEIEKHGFSMGVRGSDVAMINNMKEIIANAMNNKDNDFLDVVLAVIHEGDINNEKSNREHRRSSKTDKEK